MILAIYLDETKSTVETLDYASSIYKTLKYKRISSGHLHSTLEFNFFIWPSKIKNICVDPKVLPHQYDLYQKLQPHTRLISVWWGLDATKRLEHIANKRNSITLYYLVRVIWLFYPSIWNRRFLFQDDDCSYLIGKETNFGGSRSLKKQKMRNGWYVFFSESLKARTVPWRFGKFHGVNKSLFWRISHGCVHSLKKRAF